MKNNIGEKIRKYRKRAGMSQMALEMEIGGSHGMISRIENGAVNPSKETLLSIIEVLNIKSFEAADLFNLDTNELAKIIQTGHKLASIFDENELFQATVNEIVFSLDLLGAMLFTFDGDIIRAKTVTQSWYTRFLNKVLDVPFHGLKLKLSERKTNFVAKAILEKKIVITNKLREAAYPVISKELSNLIQTVTGTKSIIIIPVVYENICTGALLFTKGYEDNFAGELEVLKSFAEFTGNSLHNLKKIHEK